MRLGFFGGTFNPVHLGHLALASEALRLLHLDHLWWLPANPWQKNAADLMPQSERIAMLKLALSGIPHMSIDLRELDRNGPSYSIDTVIEIAKQFPDDERFYLIGADQWRNFHTWKHWQDIFDYVTLVVFNRNGQMATAKDEVIDFVKQHHIKINFLPMPALDIESSKIRQLLSQGQSDSPLLSTMLPKNVFNYLQKKAKQKTDTISTVS